MNLVPFSAVMHPYAETYCMKNSRQESTGHSQGSIPICEGVYSIFRTSDLRVFHVTRAIFQLRHEYLRSYHRHVPNILMYYCGGQVLKFRSMKDSAFSC